MSEVHLIYPVFSKCHSGISDKLNFMTYECLYERSSFAGYNAGIADASYFWLPTDFPDLKNKFKAV